MSLNTKGRHPAVQDICQYFEYSHLPEAQRFVSEAVYHLAEFMLKNLPDCSMLTRGLDNLLTAKDCFVRASLKKDDST